MRFETFKKIITKNIFNVDQFLSADEFQSKLDDLFLSEKCSSDQKTKFAVLIEQFYQKAIDLNFKNQLLNYRKKCWMNHYGVPTLEFLITHKQEINKTYAFEGEYNDIKIDPSLSYDS